MHVDLHQGEHGEWLPLLGDPCGRCRLTSAYAPKRGECTAGNRARKGRDVATFRPLCRKVRLRTGDVGSRNHGARATNDHSCTRAPAVGDRAAGAAAAPPLTAPVGGTALPQRTGDAAFKKAPFPERGEGGLGVGDPNPSAQPRTGAEQKNWPTTAPEQRERGNEEDSHNQCAAAH